MTRARTTCSESRETNYCRPTAATAKAQRGTTGGSSFTKTAVFWLAAAIVLAETIALAECRFLDEDHHNQQLPQDPLMNYDDVKDFMSDGAAAGDDDEDAESVGEPVVVVPVIHTVSLNLASNEGTTVNLPCRIEGSLDLLAVIWINGTKSIMTDGFPSTTDVRVKSGKSSDKSSAGFVEHSLVIEEVTRWDSGKYTCRVASEPPVQITHNLVVTHPAKISDVKVLGSEKSLNTGNSNKVTVKQNEPVQMICEVEGYPNVSVQWTKRAKFPQQQQSTTQNPDQDQNPVPPSPATVVVSNTNEVRIESIHVYRDAGHYECSASNTVSSSGQNTPSAHRGFDLEVEFKPDVYAIRPVVNTGETYTAQIMCLIHASPKPKVSWEKELISSDGVSTWQPILIDSPNSRYNMNRQTGITLQNTAENGSVVPPGPGYTLKVKQVQGPQDFGRYRCKAENALGISFSEPIMLTGTPAQPISHFVRVKTFTEAAIESKLPELSWNVDSWSPLVEYQLQYKRQEESPASWMDVHPQPQVVDSPIGNNTSGDERQYVLTYVFGQNDEHLDGQQSAGSTAVMPPSPLVHGVTYLARLRARNVHGWSGWSADVVFSGGSTEGRNANEINQHGGGHQHDDYKVLNASTGGGASGLQQSCGLVTVIALAASILAAKSIC